MTSVKSNLVSLLRVPAQEFHYANHTLCSRPVYQQHQDEELKMTVWNFYKKTSPRVCVTSLNIVILHCLT